MWKCEAVMHHLHTGGWSVHIKIWYAIFISLLKTLRLEERGRLFEAQICTAKKWQFPGHFQVGVCERIQGSNRFISTLNIIWGQQITTPPAL